MRGVMLVVVGALALSIPPALAQAMGGGGGGGGGRMSTLGINHGGVASGVGLGVSPFLGMSGLNYRQQALGAGAVGNRASFYPHTNGMVSGPTGSRGVGGATMSGTATGGASRSPGPPVGAATGAPSGM